MKLESLNNSKYSLTPEKMGQLVGGESIKVTSGRGRIRVGNNWVEYSSDCEIYANQQDYHNNVMNELRIYHGAQDACGCDCLYANPK